MRPFSLSQIQHCCGYHGIFLRDANDNSLIIPLFKSTYLVMCLTSLSEVISRSILHVQHLRLCTLASTSHTCRSQTAFSLYSPSQQYRKSDVSLYSHSLKVIGPCFPSRQPIKSNPKHVYLARHYRWTISVLRRRQSGNLSPTHGSLR